MGHWWRPLPLRIRAQSPNAIDLELFFAFYISGKHFDLSHEASSLIIVGFEGLKPFEVADGLMES